MFNRDVHVSRSNTPNQSSTRNTEQINESRVIENGGLNGQTNLDTHKSEPRMMDKWLVKQKKSEKFTTQTNAAKNPSTSLRTGINFIIHVMIKFGSSNPTIVMKSDLMT